MLMSFMHPRALGRLLFGSVAALALAGCVVEPNGYYGSSGYYGGGYAAPAYGYYGAPAYPPTVIIGGSYGGGYHDDDHGGGDYGHDHGGGYHDDDHGGGYHGDDHGGGGQHSAEPPHESGGGSPHTQAPSAWGGHH